MNFQTPGYNKNELRLQLVNGFVHFHDMICKCPTPLEHCVASIFEQENHLRFNKETKTLIQKCLGTTEDHTGGAADDYIEQGDLDTLFAEDFGEDDTG